VEDWITRKKQKRYELIENKIREGLDNFPLEIDKIVKAIFEGENILLPFHPSPETKKTA